MCKLVVLFIKPIAFFTFSLPSPSPYLKNPNESARRQMLKLLFENIQQITMIQMALSELVMLLKLGVLWSKLKIIKANFFPFTTKRNLVNF